MVSLRGPQMHATVNIVDNNIWFKHIASRAVVERLSALEPEAEVTVEIGGITGRWCRLKRGKDGRLPDAIRPIGEMKSVWGDWYKTRRGEKVTLRVLDTADDYLAGIAPLFSEWSSAEDEAAFHDL